MSGGDPISAALMGGSVIGQAYGAHRAGHEQSRAASRQADQYRAKGIAELALSQRRANEERRQAKLLQSSALARGGMSDGAGLGKSFQEIYAGIGERGEYNALSQLYEGRAKKQDLDYTAELTTYKGRQARRAGNMKAFMTVLDAASSMATMGATGGMGGGMPRTGGTTMQIGTPRRVG